MGVDPDDDAVGALDEVAVLLLAGLHLFEGPRVVDADGDLGSDCHEEIEIVLLERNGRLHPVHGKDTERLVPEHDGNGDERA